MSLKSSQVYKVDNSKYGVLKNVSGIWRGICEDNIDPKGLGRIKVRVHALHGAAVGGAAYSDTSQDEVGKIGNGIRTESLQWAWPCLSGGGVKDSGEFNIPLIGSSVWVTFEQGDPDYPVWLGTWPSIPEESQEINTISSWDIPDSSISNSMGTWNQESGITTPQETHNQADPSIRILAKTPKGATVISIDTDEAETLMLIDRSGQMLEMYSPVTSSKNSGNSAQRGNKTARNNDSLNPSEYCKDQKAYIRLIDTSYQNGTWSGQFIKLSAEAGKELVRIHGACGHDILLDSTSGDHKIVIKDDNGDFIFLDKDGNLKIKVLKDKKVTIEGNALIDIKGDCTTKVGGSYEIDCDSFIVKSNQASIDATASFTLKSNISSISSSSSLTLISGAAMSLSSSIYNNQVAGTATVAAALHTTTAGHISHLPGAGAPTPPETPTAPDSPNDPAGSVDIPAESYPIG